jgi:hypothetical protein
MVRLLFRNWRKNFSVEQLWHQQRSKFGLCISMCPMSVPRERVSRPLAGGQTLRPSSGGERRIRCLKGNRHRYYIFICKDVYEGAVCMRIYRSRQTEVIWDFLGKCPIITNRVHIQNSTFTNASIVKTNILMHPTILSNTLH